MPLEFIMTHELLVIAPEYFRPSQENSTEPLSIVTSNDFPQLQGWSSLSSKTNRAFQMPSYCPVLISETDVTESLEENMQCRRSASLATTPSGQSSDLDTDNRRNCPQVSAGAGVPTVFPMQSRRRSSKERPKAASIVVGHCSLTSRSNPTIAIRPKNAEAITPTGTIYQKTLSSFFIFFPSRLRSASNNNKMIAEFCAMIDI